MPTKQSDHVYTNQIKLKFPLRKKESTMSNSKQESSNKQHDVPVQEEVVNASPLIPLIMIGATLSIAAYGAWDFYREHQVISTQQIGAVKSVQASGGFNAGMVLEVENVYYPLSSTMAVRKGSIMSIEQRANGAWFLCDEQHSACSRTSTNIPK